MNSDERRAAIEASRTPVPRLDRRWVKGAFTDFPIWRVPVEHLVLNANNRRFTAEKLRWEAELERQIDPQARPIDEASILSILLDEGHRIADDQVTGKSMKSSLALMSDWKVRGQEQPLWIRPDGYVINGNRRLAALKRLANESGSATGTFSYVDVIVLEYDEINDDQMFEMEAREQLTEGFKVRYGDLNLLLTLREAAVRKDIVWTDEESVDRVAKQIQDLVGSNSQYAAVQLRAIRYMDEFLDYTGLPGQYQHVIGQVERFRDIGKNMQIALRESPEKAIDLLVLQFQSVQAGLGHLQMREIRKLMVEEPEAFAAVAAEVQEVVDSEVAAPSDEQPVIADDESDEMDEAEEAPAPPAADFPQKAVRRAVELALESRQARMKNDTESALRTAANRLQLVTPERLKLILEPPKVTVTTAINQIREWVESTRDITD